MPRSLPLLGEPPRERSDAARNRESLLVAADALIGEYGVEAVTMEAIAARAGVGKGTVFRRFDSREGLMGAVLNRSETAFQAAVISGPPALGPEPRRWSACSRSVAPGWSSTSVTGP
jgi:AcrR family transcriptional regulator